MKLQKLAVKHPLGKDYAAENAWIFPARPVNTMDKKVWEKYQR